MSYYAALPPEVNSGRIYSGPGAGSMLAAAAAWGGLAADLHAAAAACQAVVATLTSEPWLGPASATMAAAAAPYVAWLTRTAAQAEATAARAKAAAAAFDTAFALTVPPATVAANRTQLMILVAGNILGQNAAAIAAVEIHYAEMWAQDATAMCGYAAASAAATEVQPFGPPPSTSSPAGPTGALARIAADSVGAAGRAMLPALTAVPNALQGLAAPAQAVDLLTLLTPLIPAVALGVSTTSVSISPAISGAAWNAASQNSRLLLRNGDAILENTHWILRAEDELREILGSLGTAGYPAPGSAAPAASGIPVSAVTGQALSAGKLSVPASWASAAPAIRTAGYGLATAPVAPATAVPAGAGSAFSQMALAGMGGSALAGSVGRGREQPAGAIAGGVVTPGDAPIVAEIRGLARLLDEGILTEQEFTERKRHLLSR